MHEMNLLKDSTKRQVCVTITRKSHGEDYSIQLPHEHHISTVGYIKKVNDTSRHLQQRGPQQKEIDTY